jgi:hypothetical protein
MRSMKMAVEKGMDIQSVEPSFNVKDPKSNFKASNRHNIIACTTCEEFGFVDVGKDEA